MEYRPTYYFSEVDINQVIESFFEYHKIRISKKQAINIIKHCLKNFGQSFLMDMRIEDIWIEDNEIKKIIS